MRYGFVIPGGEARAVAELARSAEDTGWDAVFVAEPVWGVDAWISLTAAAMVTSTIRLGTLLTPLSRMRPWKLAAEAATLDRLSGGRVVLSVGLGALDTGFAAFGEQTDRRVRAELLDEGLAIVTGLWAGQPFAHDGKHYRVSPTGFFPPPPPIQRPRIPIWVVGAWPRPASMRRAARWDGWLPHYAGEARPDLLADGVAWLRRTRGSLDGYDVIVEGTTPGADVRAWRDAGATWWVEAMWETPEYEAVRGRLTRGPPKA